MNLSIALGWIERQFLAVVDDREHALAWLDGRELPSAAREQTDRQDPEYRLSVAERFGEVG